MPEAKAKTQSPIVTELQQLAAEAKALYNTYVKKIEALHLKEYVEKDEAELAAEATELRTKADEAFETYEKDAEALAAKFYAYIQSLETKNPKVGVAPVAKHGETGAAKDNNPENNF